MSPRRAGGTETAVSATQILHRDELAFTVVDSKPTDP